MTIVEKILARHAGEERVAPGQIVMARVDVALGNDITAPIAIREFARSGATALFDPARVVPIHTENPERFPALFGQVDAQPDGVWWKV